MIVELDNNLARIVSATDDERGWLDDYLSVEVTKFDRYRKKERQSLVSMVGTFPAGFLSLVKKRAPDDGIKIQVRDVRVRPCRATPYDTKWLRDYQQAGVDVAIKKERGVFHHVTASGKTEIIIALCMIFQCNWLILTHRKGLLSQTAKRFLKRTGEEVGQIGEGVFKMRRITIGTFDSVRLAMRRKQKVFKDYFANVGAFAVDEAHVSAAKRNKYVLLHLPKAFYRYGFSGTPFSRGDKKNPHVIGCIGPTIHRVRGRELIDRGILAKPNIVLVPIRHPRFEGTYNQAYQALVVHNKYRNATVLNIVRRAKKPALLFVREIDHGKLLEKRLSAAGIQCEFIWGDHNTHQRDAAIRRLVEGDIDVLICNVILQEGIDIPELMSVINAAGGKSIIAQLQQLGRGMRRRDADGNETKAEFEVWDICDRGCGCSKAPSSRGRHASCRWFDDHTRQRKKTFLGERYSLVINSSLAR